jgi:serine/threonine protein kinase
LSHPSIARLVSSFRFRDGAYFILEYASGGDLHSLLKRSGSLDDEAVRFISGELVAALYYIHQQGFVYSDLKPENILLTKCGHIKITDFGACRPCTAEARESLHDGGHFQLKQLRDGDWKTAHSQSSDPNLEEPDRESDPSHENDRVEGTTAYLPPEVILGAIPTQATDSWALGCVIFYCAQGRPPMLGDDDVSTRQRIVAFDLSNVRVDDISDFFKMKQAINVFVSKLLRRDPTERLTMHEALTDDFFDGFDDVLNLHKKVAPPLKGGTIAPDTDAKWNRRQFSSIWAPQPHNYSMSPMIKCSSHQHSIALNEPIIETTESESPFIISRRFIK